MQITVGVRGAIVVDHDVYTLHIDTTTENVSGNEDTLLESLERGVPFDTTNLISMVLGTEGKNLPLLLREA